MTGLIGIFFTLLFGVPSVITIWKIYSKSVLFCEIDKINLHNTLTKNIDSLSIKYKDKLINEHLFLYKALFYCNGKTDILKQDIIENLNLTFPEGTLVHECTIVETSKNFNPTFDKGINNIKFHFDLFKHDEYFYFEGIFESPIEDIKTIRPSINHRIANLGKIKYLKSKEIIKSFLELLFPIFILVLFSATSIGLSFLLNLDCYNSDDSEFSKNDNKYYASYYYELQDKVNQDYKSKILLYPSKMTNEYTIKPKYLEEKIIKCRIKKDAEFYIMTFFIIMTFLSIIFMLLYVFEYINNYKLSVLLNKLNLK